MDQKQLRALLRTMRSNGVLTYKTPELELTLDSSFLTKDKSDPEPVETASDDKWGAFPPGELTNEQLTYYSSGGVPGQEPEGLI